MDHFKSDFLKVLMLFIILFSFTSDANQGFDGCKLGMLEYFGLKSSLLESVKTAIIRYRNKIPNYHKENYLVDVNQYYWKLHTLVSAEDIELRGDFCKRLDDPEIKNALSVENPKETDCMSALVSFEKDKSIRHYSAEIARPVNICLANVPPVISVNNTMYELRSICSHWYGMSSLIDDIYPTDSQEIRISKLKKIVLYNALYLHTIGIERDSPYVYFMGTYEAVYLYDIAAKVKLINDNDYTPLKFCKEKYNIDDDGEWNKKEEMKKLIQNMLKKNQLGDKNDEGPSYLL